MKTFENERGQYWKTFNTPPHAKPLQLQMCLFMLWLKKPPEIQHGLHLNSYTFNQHVSIPHGLKNVFAVQNVKTILTVAWKALFVQVLELSKKAGILQKYARSRRQNWQDT